LALRKIQLSWAGNSLDLCDQILRLADLSGVSLRGAKLRHTDFWGTVLAHADLRGADLRGAELNDANLYAADLREADLRGAELVWAGPRGANMQGAKLQNARCYRANFEDANLHRAQLDGANLVDASFTCANLTWASLRGANLQGAELQHCNLSHAVLTDAHLRGVDLRSANLAQANLEGADLRGAKLPETNLFKANLFDVRGLMSATDWLAEHLEKVPAGWIAYKRVAEVMTWPKGWRESWPHPAPGVVLRANVLPDRTCYGSGISLATLDWCREHYKGAPLWRVLIRWEWAAGIVVPYRTDGEFRCERCELMEQVE